LFSGTAGQWVSVGVSDTTIGAVNCCTTSKVAIYKPDGTALLAPTDFYQAGVGTPSVQLPTSGTYAIFVDPYLAVAGNATITLSEDLSPPITLGGSSVFVNFARIGQNAAIDFAGTAGQQVIVRITGNTVGNVAVKLLKPDGTQLTSATSSSSSFSLASQTLPVTGTYFVTLDPSTLVPGGLNVFLENPAANLALNKTATQSSTNFSAPASRAVDGNTDGNFSNGSVTHTQVENQAWWHVDLGSVQSIGRIDVFNRTDCCGSALTNFYVFVSDVPFTSTDVTATQNQSGVFTYNNTGQAGSPTSININRTGRYIRVQLAGTERLSLAEVQVWP
jgi:F5/8 type C domain-containing protein